MYDSFCSNEMNKMDKIKNVVHLLKLLGRPSNITFIVLIYQFYIKVRAKTAERWRYKT